MHTKMKRLTRLYWNLRHLMSVRVKTRVLLSAMVFVATCTASLIYWANVRANVNKDLHTTYQRQVRGVTQDLAARLALYENLLHGGAGLLGVRSDLTQADWVRFFQDYDITRRYPSIEGIGLNRYITKDDVPALTQDVADRGLPNYAIWPAGQRDVYVPVVLNAMYAGNSGKSIGFDGWTNPTRRAAMQQAVRTGQPVMSGKIELVSAAAPHRAASIMYMPVYRPGAATGTPQQRQAALYGFVYAAIDLRTMLHSTMVANRSSYFGMQLYDITSGKPTLAYQTDTVPQLQHRHGLVTSNTAVTLYGHAWQFRFIGTNDLIPRTERQLPMQALWRGLLAGALFAGVVWYLISAREHKLNRMKQLEVQTAKDDLLSLASHQLRTPATVVKQYVGMLLQGYGGKLTGQQIGMLDHAYESNERQLEIINQLLYVARLDAGRIKLRYRKVAIGALTKDVIADQSSAIAQRGQTLTYRPPRRKLNCDADPHYLRMVIENLLSNAIKYTAEGGSITVTVRRQLEKRRVVIEVSDTGVGIVPSQLGPIFEKFTRVENELSNDVNGSGVGLYLTKQIVELHHGTIAVKSTPGEGSMFTVTIPLHKPLKEKV